MNQDELKILEINGKNYFLIDSLDGNNNTYYFFSENIKNGNICVLKKEQENGESFFVSLDDDKELDYALGLFFNKYGEGSNYLEG